ncbi:MAG: LLM class flavin-dependent oxidoreductase [Dehalococcoidia bacterium]|nr:LLM class flavin-dependent oxidoreductase [Dehalococcoidia bacterium]
MAYRPKRMKFGIFMAPFHRVGENPTLALKRDIELIEVLDRLGYDEAWIGEHHSLGREIIADPAVFIGAAAMVTRKIRLGTGVTSLGYHHPLMVADKMLQLDHMTEGRAMLGVGPGALTSDAYQMGIDPTELRGRMAESLDAIMRLFEAKAPVSMETDWFTLREARLQMASYSSPHLPVAVAASVTPSGPILAGKHGVGLLSVAGASHETFGRTWGWVEEAAAEAGKTVDRGEWRVVIPVHLADSKREALDDIREGFKRRAYVGDRKTPIEGVTGGGLLAGAAGTSGGSLEEAAETGAMIVGTPDDAIAQIAAIQERAGGLGGLMVLANELTSTEKIHRSYELLARYVMPVFQGQTQTIIENRDWIEDNEAAVFRGQGKAMRKAFSDAGKEMPPDVANVYQRGAAASDRGQ